VTLLVAYRSKRGSTQEVAKAIARRVGGHEVEVRRAADVEEPTPASDARDWDAIDKWADEVAAALEPRNLAGRQA
jgi:menaquinone-dependent protoporphyrinogen IX oxidase